MTPVLNQTVPTGPLTYLSDPYTMLRITQNYTVLFGKVEQLLKETLLV